MINKLDIEMFHDESWKSIYFAVNRSKVKTSELVVRQNAALLLLHA